MAVYGSIKDPMAAPGPYETLEPPKLVGISTASTFFVQFQLNTMVPFDVGGQICPFAN